MSALPKGWTQEPLAKLGTWTGGGTPSTTNADFWTNGTIPWVSPKDMKQRRITTAQDSITEAAVRASTTNLIPENSVMLVTRSGILRHSLPVATNTQPVTLNQDMKALTPLEALLPDYLYFAFRRYERDILHGCCKGGTTVQSIEAPRLMAFEIPVPPLAEQRRIVGKVEELFSELDEGVANLKQARAQLAVYRQALLKHAFEGHLTADWRTTHAPEPESADQLLARIHAEREERYQDDLRAWNNRKGKGDLIRDGEILTKPRKPKAPYRLDSDEEAKLTELPSSWKWMTFESLSSPAQRSIQSGPFGSSLKHSEFSEEGILVIGIDNVQKGYFSKGSQNRIPPKTYERLRKYSARPHDVLMTVMATVGRCCSVPADLETAIITKHVYRTSPNLRLVSPSFVVSALLGCPATVKAVEKDKVGQTRPGINGDILKWLPIPLPPLEEQEEIMRNVSASLEGVDALEADIDLNLQKAEALRQSILKKAFAGELVPQDPADEPAAALLARIRAEREAQPVNRRTRR